VTAQTTKTAPPDPAANPTAVEEPWTPAMADGRGHEPPDAAGDREASGDAPKPNAAEPLVDLDDIAPDRPTVKWHGDLYELARLDDFGIATQQALTRDGREFSTLWSAEDELDQNQRARLKMLLERMFEQVVMAPKAVKRRFSDAEKSRVVLAFTIAPLAQAAARQAEREQEQEARETSPSISAS
jgi:hypothetical protein